MGGFLFPGRTGQPGESHAHPWPEVPCLSTQQLFPSLTRYQAGVVDGMFVTSNKAYRGAR